MDDIIERGQKAVQKSIISPTRPDPEANCNENGNPNNNSVGEGEARSDHKIVAMTAPGKHNEMQARGLSTRANILEAEFERTGTVVFIEKAIELRIQALSLTPEAHVDRAGRLSNLGISLCRRFNRLGELANVDEAIKLQTQAVLLTPDGHVDKPGQLNGLGNAYLSRFEHLGEVVDVDKAIECLTQAVLLTPEENENKPTGLKNLGNSYTSRFERFGELADLDKAIEFHTQALLLTSNGHASKPGRLNALGNSYQSRFAHLGEVADVDKAIECQSQAVLLTPDGQADKPLWLNNLGNSYRSRFERLGKVTDVDKAIECLSQAVLLTPDGHPSKPTQLNNLGNSYRCRFAHLGELSDVNKAIECHTQAVLLTPHDHASKPGWLSNLGSSYDNRFRHFGELSDVDKAIECQTQAVLLTPDSHANRPGRLNNLGISYLSRFERLGVVSDVSKAIEYQTEAVLLAPDGHAGKPIWFNNLGISYLRRFARVGEIEDLDKAIKFHTQAVMLTPDGHAAKPDRLDNLGNSYQIRFERLGEVKDVDKAIEYQTRAMLTTPDGHAHKPGRLSNLGSAYGRRFERLGKVEDVEKAIECFTQAVPLTPDGHADKPSRLNNLGNSYMMRFQCLGQHPDLESAQSSYQSAAQVIVTNPRTQISCAIRWAGCCASLGVSPQPAYERCMDLLPRLIWLGTTIAQRYDLLTTISDYVAEAAAWAISAQAYDAAIEWLEQGRSIVWNQILQLRTPFDELAAHNPSLSDRLKAVAARLEAAGTRGAESSSTNNAPPALEKDAQRHHRLADEWEQALAEARTIPGFESFMLPRRAEELKRSATDGPIVLINAHSSRSDALIIFPESNDIAHLPLVNLPLDKTDQFREQLYSLARHRGDSDRGIIRVRRAHRPDDRFKCMLSELWSAIVRPVLDALGYTRERAVDELPHVTWCATGPLAFLPLHAAGPYDGVSPNAGDLVISSYTPTLSALLALHIPSLPSEVGLLAVGQQETRGLPALPYTVQELAAIEEHAKAIDYHQLDGREATVNAVLDAMEEYGWVHLACHAGQNPHNPADSAFHLHDGDLTLESITKRQFKNKGLAFLSACQTAAGDCNLPDEAVHLAAGMLMAGYPSVIATMWRIRDEDGPEIAGRVYAELLKNGRMDNKGAAKALHKAVAGLREKAGEDSPNRWNWVPFIHIGV